MTNQRGSGPKSRVRAGNPGSRPYWRAATLVSVDAAQPRVPGLLLVQFLSGTNRPCGRAIETAPGGLDLGLGSTFATRIRLRRLRAVLRDVEADDGARRAMQETLGGSLGGSQSKSDRENKQQTITHSGSFLL